MKRVSWLYAIWTSYIYFFSKISITKTKKVNLYFLLICLQAFSIFSQTGWFEQNSGTNLQLNDIFMMDSFTGWCVGYGGKILKTTNGGNNWVSQLSGVNEYFYSVFFINYTTGFSGTVGGLMYKTLNGGATWSPQNTGSNASIAEIYFVNSLTGWYVGTIESPIAAIVMKTTNSGNNWFVQRSMANSYHVACYFYNDSIGWVAGDNIIKTTNSGVSWITANAPLNNYSAIIFKNLLTGYCVGNSVFKSTDGGLNWIVQFNTSGFDVFFRDVSTGWFCGNLGSIYYTTNGGLNWLLQSTPVGDPLYSIVFTNALTGYCVGGFTGKILKTTTGGLTAIYPITNEVPVKFCIYQNYPNPFNPTTNIKFQVASRGLVQIKVYDILGKEAVILVNENLAPGTYEVQFNGRNLPSGTYFYRLIADNYIATKRMILIK